MILLTLFALHRVHPGYFNMCPFEKCLNLIVPHPRSKRRAIPQSLESSRGVGISLIASLLSSAPPRPALQSDIVKKDHTIFSHAWL